MVRELDLISDLVEEQLIRGKLRWLANFTEIRRGFRIDGLNISLYAKGRLGERGFFLSRIFSFFVTPKYGVHLLLYAGDKISGESLRKLIWACKRRFGEEDWVFIGVMQKKPISRDLRRVVLSVGEKTVGVVAFSLSSRETLNSDNFLGRSLRKRLNLAQLMFEAFDLPDYLKSVTIIFFLGTLGLISLAYSGLPAVTPLSLLFLLIFSIVMGYPLYKNKYHVTLFMDSRGFEVKRGKTTVSGKWSEFDSISIQVSPRGEYSIRLHSKERFVDIPASRIGVPRRNLYETIRRLTQKKPA